MSIMLITHDLGVVAKMCDRVVVMYAGQIVEQGRVDEIFTKPTPHILKVYYRLYQEWIWNVVEL